MERGGIMNNDPNLAAISQRLTKSEEDRCDAYRLFYSLLSVKPKSTKQNAVINDV